MYCFQVKAESDVKGTAYVCVCAVVYSHQSGRMTGDGRLSSMNEIYICLWRRRDNNWFSERELYHIFLYRHIGMFLTLIYLFFNHNISFYTHAASTMYPNYISFYMGFLSHYVNGYLPYVWSHITINKLCWVWIYDTMSLNKTRKEESYLTTHFYGYIIYGIRHRKGLLR